MFETSKSLNALPHALDSEKQTFHFRRVEVGGLGGHINGIYSDCIKVLGMKHS